jgi:hypothetical protein
MAKTMCSQVGGSRCSICMSHFGDGDSVCAQGHMIGQEYEVPVAAKRQIRTPASQAHLPHSPQAEILCGQIDGTHCSVCMQNFPDGDDICIQGHQVGQSYPNPRLVTV